MTLFEFALLAIALGILFYVRKLSEYPDQFQRLAAELKAFKESLISPHADRWVLNQINNHLYHIEEFVQGSRNSLDIKRKRSERIVAMYVAFLQEKEGLTPEQALLKASYISQKFIDSNEWIVDHIRWKWQSYGSSERQELVAKFEQSELFLNDVSAAEARILSRDVFSALWVLFKKSDYRPRTILAMAHPPLFTSRYDDYDSLIKKKAIIARLQKLGLLSQVDRGRDGHERFRLVHEDFETLRSLLDRFGDEQDWSLEERWEEKTLLPVLEEDSVQD